LAFGLLGGVLAASAAGADDVPKSADPRLVVERFAAAPDIVHPIAVDFDARGRLLVVESHTHFRPPNYAGPETDRIRVLEDTTGDGKADRVTTFFEGLKATMDLAVHPDGSVYVATRNEVLRLRDTTGDGKADERTRLVFLDTKGNYPHNGLSGLCFDFAGNLYFGMGENLGVSYRLLGADERAISGEGDGGHIFWCTADGRQLRRVATGFWNPFGVCQDSFGRIFAVDNDPDGMPPCRLVHVVEGGDYGYQFRYGRTGRHPFQAWDGQLPGTLPMAAGTGEAPCEVLAYESDGLPPEYRGQLLVTSWADHRVERYELSPRGASWAAVRKPFLQGGSEFRPVGLAVAPDGSLFVSDWVRRDYHLHGQGAIWHLRPRDRKPPDRSLPVEESLRSAHRPTREAAARKLAADPASRALLRAELAADRMQSSPRVRGTSLSALLAVHDPAFDLRAYAERETELPLRVRAVQALAERGHDVRSFLDPKKQPPAVRAAAIRSLNQVGDVPRLVDLCVDADPFLRHAAIQQLVRNADLLDAADRVKSLTPPQRTALLLAWRASERPEGRRRIRDALSSPEHDLRLLAAKWVSDDKLTEARPWIENALQDATLNVTLFHALATALARLEGGEVSERQLADRFAARLYDEKVPAEAKAQALRVVPSTHPKLTTGLLSELIQSGARPLALEALRALAEHPAPARGTRLRELASQESLDPGLRAFAVLGLAERASEVQADLLRWTGDAVPAVRDEALRSLLGVRLPEGDRTRLEALARRMPETEPLIARLLGRPHAAGRPPASDLAAWQKRLQGPADVEAGRRVFFHAKLAGCYRCHRAEGRGHDIGPDLSSIGRMSRERLLDSILRPSAEVAPHFQVWRLGTADGQVRVGMLTRTHLDEYTYIDPEAKPFTLRTTEIESTEPLPQSIMPDGLADRLTDQELRDLLAYLESLR
jgi:putative membrane-bound dehydrogenase-like protein